MYDRKSLEHIIRNALEARKQVQYVGRPDGGDGNALGRQAAVLATTLNIDESMQLGRHEFIPNNFFGSDEDGGELPPPPEQITRDSTGRIRHTFKPNEEFPPRTVKSEAVASSPMRVGRADLGHGRNTPVVSTGADGNIVIFYPRPKPAARSAQGGKRLEEGFGGFNLHPAHIIDYALQNTDSLLAKGHFAQPHELIDGATIAHTAAQLANSGDRTPGTNQLVYNLMHGADLLKRKAEYLSHMSPNYIQNR